MNTHYPLETKPATPETILDILIDSHRQQCEYDPEADPEITLSFATTVEEWSWACDLLPVYMLGRALNKWFKTALTDGEWERVLEPAEEHTLREVCELIASQASVYDIEPARFFGKPCLSSSTFLTIRALLQQHDTTASAIRPSTPLSPWLRRHTQAFVQEVNSLAPGALPPAKIDSPIATICRNLSCLAMVGCILGGCIGGLKGNVNYLIGAGVCLGLAGAAGRAAEKAEELWPRSVQWDSLETFRDLTLAIVQHREQKGF